jgi:glycosyltransferase involved in cell wall biosynthesis
VGEDRTKCIEIPNAAAIPPVLGALPADLDATLSREAGAGRQVLAYAGAHGVSNGLHEVLDALRLLRNDDARSYGDLSVIFVGDGPRKIALQSHTEVARHGHVFFFDAIPKPAAMTVMSRADYVLVHFAGAAFKRYGMSANKLFDAMAVGRPILLSSPLKDTPVDLVKCGIRYEPGAAANLARAISSAMRVSAPERRLMGERGHAEARRKYSLATTGGQLERVLLDAISL